MKAILTCVAAAMLGCVSSNALATPQKVDTLRYGVHTFPISEMPMLGLWHVGDGEPPQGKSRPPSFEVTSSANWSGYSAEWGIARGKLLLFSISGRIKGKQVRNKAILPNESFPAVATWFTGKIHLPVGDFNEDTQEYESVIVFEIDKGVVRSKQYLPAARLPRTWNGLE
jgi:hypothetical protein